MSIIREPPYWWFNTYVESPSRWLGRKDGELVVYKVFWENGDGDYQNYRITSYDVECEETGECKAVPYDTFQKLITNKRLINIGEHTKEEWIEMSKQ